MPSDLSAREQAVLDVLPGAMASVFNQVSSRVLARRIVAALDRLDAPCPECVGDGRLWLGGEWWIVTTYSTDIETGYEVAHIRRKTDPLHPWEESGPCPECGGSGYIEKYAPNTNGDVKVKHPCPSCGGTPSQDGAS